MGDSDCWICNEVNEQMTKSTIKIQLPNSTGILVLGILSIVFCCCYGILGVVFGVIAISLSKNALREYESNPEQYTITSVKNMRAGRICAIIGLIFSGTMMLLTVIGVLSDTFHFTWSEFEDFLMLD